MEFLIWMAIGIALMAVELVVPGGILGLIGYCAFLWGVFVALGEGTVALYAVLGLTALLIVLIIVFFNHFEKTWIGKLFTLGQRSTTKAGYVSNDVLDDLVGKEGVAHTTLRPAGCRYFSFDSHSTDWDYGVLVCCAIRPLGICSCSGR